MSADNWAVCPRCIDTARRDADDAKLKVMGLYGVVPLEEFEAKRDALTEPNPEDFETFREDYEIHGAEDGEIQVSYSGICTKCGIGADFAHTRRFWP